MYTPCRDIDIVSFTIIRTFRLIPPPVYHREPSGVPVLVYTANKLFLRILTSWLHRSQNHNIHIQLSQFFTIEIYVSIVHKSFEIN